MMKNRNTVLAALPGLLALLSAPVLKADVVPANLFQDNMILQRDAKIHVYGKADPGEKVTVSFRGKTAEAVADQSGAWSAYLPPMEASAKGESLRFEGKNTVERKNVVTGDIWFAAGQSNMAFLMKSVRNAAEEIANSAEPRLRFFVASGAPGPEMLNETKGKWFVSEPASCPNFSAVAYFFAREILRRTGIPQGVLQVAVGCTRCQSWISHKTLSTKPEEYALFLKEFAEEDYRCMFFRDPGRSAESKNWEAAELDMSSPEWKDIEPPGLVVGMSTKNYIENVFGGVNGVFWFRRDIILPKEAAGKDLRVHFVADDLDTAWFNGEKIGSTGKDTPYYYYAKRTYTIPGKFVREGRNSLAIRVLDEYYGGGLTGDLYVENDAGYRQDISGKGWKIRAEYAEKPGKAGTTGKIEHMPCYYYNALVHPYTPFTIKGAIWYQGCCNTSGSYPFGLYTKLLTDLIASWRAEWGIGDFPFYIVQLANYLKAEKTPAAAWNGYPGVRYEQYLVSQQVPHTGVACIIDIGEARDIHPKNKQDAGYRLALPALAADYGLKLEYSGPRFESMSVENGKIRCRFSHAAGLFSKDGANTGFGICGENGKYYNADAVIDGSDVIVSSPDVPNPVGVCYGWANNPPCSFYNSDKLPMFPFRTK